MNVWRELKAIVQHNRELYYRRHGDFLQPYSALSAFMYLSGVVNSWDAEWRKWFAWRPVKLKSGRYAWLEYVYRRKHKVTVANKQKATLDLPGRARITFNTYDFKLIEDIFIDRHDAVFEKLKNEPMSPKVNSILLKGYIKEPIAIN